MRVYYLRDLSDPNSDRWILYPIPNCLDEVMQWARDRFGVFPHATGFQIVSREGAVLAQEARAA